MMRVACTPGAKFVSLDDLTGAGKNLTTFEPSEVVTVKGVMFEVDMIQLDPPLLVLVPVEGEQGA